MKPFNLEEAKAGKPVCTKDGRPVRIIEFDMKDKEFPIVAIIPHGNKEGVETFTIQGSYYTQKEDQRDLMMASVEEEGWVNVYKSKYKNTFSVIPIFKEEVFCGTVYKTKEEACIKKEENDSLIYIDTVKIKFEPK